MLADKDDDSKGKTGPKPVAKPDKDAGKEV